MLRGDAEVSGLRNQRCVGHVERDLESPSSAHRQRDKSVARAIPLVLQHKAFRCKEVRMLTRDRERDRRTTIPPANDVLRGVTQQRYLLLNVATRDSEPGWRRQHAAIDAVGEDVVVDRDFHGLRPY